MCVYRAHWNAMTVHLLDEESFECGSGLPGWALDFKVAEDENPHVSGIGNLDMGPLEGDGASFPDAPLWVDDVVVPDIRPTVAAMTDTDLFDS